MIINPLGKDIVQVTTNFCGKPLTLEVNRVGFRTTASVTAKYGDAVVLASVSVGKADPNMDYFPLSVDYEERFYASGKISSSRFIKREGRPSDQAVLSGRIIDRPIRPLFPKGYRQEIQCVATVLAMDPAFRPDMLGMIAVSAGLMLTGVPFDGPVAGLRVGRIDGKFVPFPSNEQIDNESDLDLTVGAIESGITMVEAGANEVSEDILADAMEYAFKAIQPAIKLQKELAKKVGVTPVEYELHLPDENIAVKMDKWVDEHYSANLRQPYPFYNQNIEKLAEKMNQELVEELGEEVYEEQKDAYNEAFTLATYRKVREGIVKEGIRPDGRALDEVRSLSSEVQVLPRVHGSSLFTRGVTQALNVVTLAPLSYSQLVDTMEVTDGKRRYMHHYNAPGYTVGEIQRLGSPGRREIGHGYLAERALIPVLPSEEDFPYAIRSVTEIMSQNGSTSMAATCASCLALMDAGVPLTRPVAGVAMGLMMADGKAHVLTDLADMEDFSGDMDFKVTGTDRGVTAVQMDMKVHGLPMDILREALKKSHTGRMKIMKHMKSVIAAPRKELSPYAPRIEKLMINPEKIGMVIGKGGETIQEITRETGTEIDIDDSGLITVASPDGEKIAKALEWIRGLVEEPEIGKVYKGEVVSVKDFGAFVNILPDTDGMVHISELQDKRTTKVTDVVKIGQPVNVKLQAIDDKGRLSLTMKGVKQPKLK
ncbi:MAG: polyribonucleotide nucleotidyltransferase [Candidatus Nanosyncoccaceae bacterium]|jgi:polyribonucleotide nucleotidyltransferase